MRTQFFKDMVYRDDNRLVLQPHPNVLYTEQVVGLEAAEKLASEMLEDDQNPYKNAKVYRAMLREQYMTIARMRAGGLSDGKLT